MLNIKTLRHLSLRLQIDIDKIQEISENISSHCKQVEIKSKGKTRLVFNITKELSRIQVAIHKNLLLKVPLSDCAHGAVSKKSPKTNVQNHCGQRFVFCLDFKSCFPNIHSSRVRKLFEESLGCSPSVSRLLTRLTTFNYHLAQGFHTSSAILNIICIEVDNNIKKYISRKNLFYSRYIDDVTISGPFISQHTCEQIKSIIINSGFIINPLKEKYSQGDSSICITGLNISGKHPKVPRKYKRNIRAAIKQLHDNMSSTTPVDVEKQTNSLNGKLQYIRHIES